MECTLVLFQNVVSVCLCTWGWHSLASTFPIQEKQRLAKILEGCSLCSTAVNFDHLIHFPCSDPWTDSKCTSGQNRELDGHLKISLSQCSTVCVFVCIWVYSPCNRLVSYFAFFGTNWSILVWKVFTVWLCMLKYPLMCLICMAYLVCIACICTYLLLLTN